MIWEIDTGYFDCRNHDSSFNAKKFAKRAQLKQVKIIEIKRSQGLKPGKGEVLSKEKFPKKLPVHAMWRWIVILFDL